MKKIRVLSIILFFMIIININGEVYSQNDANTYLRIGLITYYENQEIITVHNSKLVMGYEIKGDWIPEYELQGYSSYNFIPVQGYFLVSRQDYSNYKQAKEICDILMSNGYEAYPTNQGIGSWKVYMGRYTDKEAASIDCNNTNQLDYIQFDISADNGKRIKVQADNEILILIDSNYDYPQFQDLDQNGIINLGKRSYRGKIEIGRYGGNGVSAINVIGVEEYLYGVLPSEVSPNWPIESLKTQAVAARTYAIFYAVVSPKYKNKSYDLTDTISSQVYGGYTCEQDITNIAVDQTEGEMIYFRDEIIAAYFFSTSGGRTENSENVWSGTVPYLKSVSDIYEVTPAADPWIKEISSSEIKQMLAKYDINIGDIIDIVPVNYTESNRALSVIIRGTNGVKEVQKETIRSWLGLRSRKFFVVTDNYKPEVSAVNSNLESYNNVNLENICVIDGNNKVNNLSFTKNQVVAVGKDNMMNYTNINYNNDRFTFVGMGYGHGVGMSQSGAKGMAQAGFTYKEILTHYYTGTVVK